MAADGEMSLILWTGKKNLNWIKHRLGNSRKLRWKFRRRISIRKMETLGTLVCVFESQEDMTRRM